MAVTRKVGGVSRVKNKRASVDDGEALVLPREVNAPPGNMSDYILFLFGEKGVGKTSVMAQVPDLIICEWEPRRRHLPVYQIPKPGEEPLTWRRFQRYCDLFIKEGKPVGIDTVDRCWEACLREHCQEMGIGSPQELNDYGATWAKIKEDFETTFNALLFEGISLVFTSHARLREVKGRVGDPYDEVIPTCSGTPWSYLKAIADMSFYFGFRGKDRIYHTRPTMDPIWCSCGLSTHFLTPEGTEVHELFAGNSPEEAYQILLDSFANKVEEFGVQISPKELRDINLKGAPSRKKK